MFRCWFGGSVLGVRSFRKGLPHVAAYQPRFVHWCSFNLCFLCGVTFHAYMFFSSVPILAHLVVSS